MGKVSAFYEDGGPVLATEHAHESGAAQSTVAALGDCDNGAVEPGGVEEVLFVEGVVRVSSSGFIIKVARDGGIHADGREAVGLDATLLGLCLELVCRIKVQTD